MSRIAYAKPSITELEIEYAIDAAKNGWGEDCYTYINRFESLFKEHLGVGYAIATSSCTGALHLGMAGLGIRPGDEVILADTNWIASAAPILYLGATPIFVDILPDTWCIDPLKVEAAITPRTKAILAVHLYGNVCDMDALLSLGREYNVHIIEDAAEAIGSKYQHKPAGSMGVFGAFSFHGTKTISTGEGGMFVTSDTDLFETVLTLSNHGRVQSEIRQFSPALLGYKYKISNLQAAIGCAQINRVEELISGKRKVFSYYAEKFANLPLEMNPEPKHTVNGFWMPSIVIDSSIEFDRQALMRRMASDGIDSREFFSPLSSLPFFESRTDNALSYDIGYRALNLPSYHDLTHQEMDRVIEHVRAELFE